MIFLGYLAIFCVVAAVVFFLSSFYLSYFRLLRGEAPFVPLPQRALAEVVKALEIKAGSVVYDLGCGDGRVLLACREAEPGAKYVGFEKNFVIYLLAKIKTSRLKKPHSVAISKKDFFLENLSPATHVFTYLLSRPMSGLSQKLPGELRPGTRLVSCEFPLKNRKPNRVIDLRPKKFLSVNKLYVYDF